MKRVWQKGYVDGGSAYLYKTGHRRYTALLKDSAVDWHVFRAATEKEAQYLFDVIVDLHSNGSEFWTQEGRGGEVQIRFNKRPLWH